MESVKYKQHILSVVTNLRMVYAVKLNSKLSKIKLDQSLNFQHVFESMSDEHFSWTTFLISHGYFD